MKCIVQCCANSKRLHPTGVSFYGFPPDENGRKLWLDKIGDVCLRKSSVICSDHFRPEMKIRISNRSFLREGAAPELNLSKRKPSLLIESTTAEDSISSGRLILENFVHQPCYGAYDAHAAHSNWAICDIPTDTMNSTQPTFTGHIGDDLNTMSDCMMVDVIDVPSDNAITIPIPVDLVPSTCSEQGFSSSERMSCMTFLSGTSNHDAGFPYTVFDRNPVMVHADSEQSGFQFSNFEQHNETEMGDCEKLCPQCAEKSITIEKMQAKINAMEKRIQQKNSQIRLLRKKNNRKVKKTVTLKTIVSSLKKENLICENVRQTLQNINGANQKIAERQLFQRSKLSSENKYDDEIRAFALNLNFLSPKAYEYVRSTFRNCLPHNRTLRKWYEGVDCAPGFTKEAFVAIKKIADVARDNNEIIVVNLAYDEIYIRQHVQWVGKRAFGYVDFGDGGFSDTIANQMLVFMVVFINRPWKIPVAYFPIATVTAQQKVNLVSLCIEHLEEAGVLVVGVTFDGLATNLQMSKQLGSDIRNVNAEHIDGHVFHPDTCHMLKLCRNALGELETLIDKDGDKIEWKYILLLQQLQEAEGLHVGNKLRKAHVYFKKQKMNVRLAVQTLSTSVADAIDCCREGLGLEQFAGSEATVKFIRIFNDVFDILNSRKLYAAVPTKMALCENNANFVLGIAQKACDYIEHLRLPSGQLLIKSKRKVGFVGLIKGLKNLPILYQRFIQPNILKFIPMYKLSQDHLELFFGSIRTGLGYNTNPTVQQFTSRYKKLLFRTQLRDGGMGNCLPLEHVPILNAISQNPVDEINNTVDRPHMAEENDAHASCSYSNIPEEHRYAAHPEKLSTFVENVVEYIAGFVVFKLYHTLHCDNCINAIQGEVDNNRHTVLTYKNRGFLKVPSESVVFICKKAEEQIRRSERCGNSRLLSEGTFQSIVLEVKKKCIEQNLFDDENAHMTATMHYSHLIKAITEKYLNTRYHFEAKKLSEKLSIRQHLNKIVQRNGM